MLFDDSGGEAFVFHQRCPRATVPSTGRRLARWSAEERLAPVERAIALRLIPPLIIHVGEDHDRRVADVERRASAAGKNAESRRSEDTLHFATTSVRNAPSSASSRGVRSMSNFGSDASTTSR